MIRTSGTRLIIIAAAGAVFACSDPTTPDRSGTFLGPLTVMAGGTAHTYVTLDRDGNPTELGVAISETALAGLPATSTEYLLTLPLESSATAYNHATLNWQPTGHPPAGVYTVPHFDFHFYMVTLAERNAILLGTAELSAKMVRQPPAEFIPQSFVPGMSMVQMGMHWIDPTAPERNGQPFTHTFFYGSYDGTIMLHEPLVAKSYLETKPAAVTTPIKLAAQFATRGYQATSYTIAYDAATKEFRIALSGLILR